jgi:hypothetical protein
MNAMLQAFLIRVGISLAKRLHNGPLHRLMERKRKELDEKDSMRVDSDK